MYGSMTRFPKSTGCFSQMKLDLSGCQSLMALPNSIGNLSQLSDLTLAGCSSLGALTAGISELLLLQRLDLTNCLSLTTLPEAIFAALGQLKVLKLDCCT